jgi:hypothetical protein
MIQVISYFHFVGFLHFFLKADYQKIGELISPVIIQVNQMSKRSIIVEGAKINLILNGFGTEFHLKLQPINYTFLLSDGSDNTSKPQCFYNGFVNDDTASSRVYINLCRPNRLVSSLN